MSGSVNKVILIGLLGKDPIIKTFQNGGKIANLSLATSERWKDKQSGEYVKKTEWHRIVVKNNDALVSIAEKYLKSGSHVYIEGKIETRKYDDKGVEKSLTEIVIGYGGTITLLDSKPKSQDEYSGDRVAKNIQQGNDDDDDIPF
jgi:single-strand DNA-binding protein